MTSKSGLNAYRERVFAAMSDAGLPVAQWHRQNEERLSRDPTSRARPFTTLTSPKYGKIQKLRPGFEEFIPHPAHGRPVPRCQAARKRTGGREQCRKFAIRGKHLCRTHGGAVGSGQLTDQGRKNQIASVTQHGRETTEKRQARKIATRKLKALENLMRDNGMISGLGSRGPYWKPNRVGEAMSHLKGGRKVS